MCTEIAHKVMRTDTVLDTLMKMKNLPDGDRQFKAYIIGRVILTEYNNKTYTVDDIDFQTTPRSSFRCQDDSMKNYIEYYKQVII